jgi:chemotaxis signal transduction protein
MAVFSSLRSRRFARHQAEATQTLITFQLGSEGFALPIETVQKVIILDEVYGDPSGRGIGLTHYQNQEIIVIDLGYRIFGEQSQLIIPEDDPSKIRYLLILYNPEGALTGLPIDSAPKIRRVGKSAIQPLPDAYLKQDILGGLSSQIVYLEKELPLFLLDTLALLQYN